MIKFDIMTAQEILSDIIVPLKTSDTVEVAISMMNEFKVSHLPIVNNLAYLGLVSEGDLEDNMEDIDLPIGNIKLSLARPMIEGFHHVYDVIRIMSEMGLSVLPVVDAEENYLGVVSLESLNRQLVHLAAVDNPGAVLVLSMSQNDYSLSEIAQIVESNDAKILSMYITSDIDSTNLDVIIKVNKQDIEGIINTFNRYNYTIKAFYGRDENPDDLRDRFDSLMNYLNV